MFNKANRNIQPNSVEKSILGAYLKPRVPEPHPLRPKETSSEYMALPDSSPIKNNEQGFRIEDIIDLDETERPLSKPEHQIKSLFKVEEPLEPLKPLIDNEEADEAQESDGSDKHEQAELSQTTEEYEPEEESDEAGSGCTESSEESDAKDYGEESQMTKPPTDQLKFNEERDDEGEQKIHFKQEQGYENNNNEDHEEGIGSPVGFSRPDVRPDVTVKARGKFNLRQIVPDFSRPIDGAIIDTFQMGKTNLLKLGRFGKSALLKMGEFGKSNLLKMGEFGKTNLLKVGEFGKSNLLKMSEIGKSALGLPTSKDKANKALLDKMLAEEKRLDRERLEKELADRRKKVKAAINRRKAIRFFFYFLYLALAAGILAVCFIKLMEHGRTTIPVNSDLSFTLNNCALKIYDHDSSISSPIYMKYSVPHELKVDEETKLSIAIEGNMYKLEILNDDLEAKYCLVELYIKGGNTINSFGITCTSCNITQDNSFQLEVLNNVNITGDVVHANFRNIKAGSFNFQSIKGYLQLNNIDTSTSATNVIDLEKDGDIIIQSTQDFSVNGTTDTRAYCLHAPNVELLDGPDNNCSVIDPLNSTEKLCVFSFNLCQDTPCGTSLPTYQIKSTLGNFYANIIPQIGSPVNISQNATYGEIYSSHNITFNSDTIGDLEQFNNAIANQSSKGSPFTILHMGDLHSQSSRYSKWVVSSKPSYSYMRPYWIGTFSATLLTGQIDQVYGQLLPGLCPFTPDFTTSDLLVVQERLKDYVTAENTLITFLVDGTSPPPATTPKDNTGVFYYDEGNDPFDHWYSLSYLSDGSIFIDDNNYSKSPGILGTIVLSLIIAVYVAFLVIHLAIIAINMTYHKLVNFANHLHNYSMLELSKSEKMKANKKENKQKTNASTQVKYTLSNIMSHAPSPSAFIDYFSLIAYRQISSSVIQFYQLLFKQVPAEVIRDQELDPSRDTLKGTHVKLLYEKFCFMNHIPEEKLIDKKNVAILEKYGFEIRTREDVLNEVFTKINIKNYDNFTIHHSPDADQNITSLDLYIEENVELTQFFEDQVEVETFIKIYNSFCEYNRLPREIVSPQAMKEKYNVVVSSVPQQFIVRKPQDEEDNEEINQTYEEPHWSQRLLNFNLRKPASKKTYIIDTSKLDNHFNLIMGKFKELNENDLESATVDLILYPNWWFWDGVTVLLHMVGEVIITLPMVAIVLLNESQYSPWSMKDPSTLVSFTDIFRDPLTLMVNLYTTFVWNRAIMIIVSILWAMSILDLILYYSVMEFPQDKSFKRSEGQSENFWHRISRQVEWILVLLALTFYFGCIGLLLTWLLLGAFIDPNAFLPLASAAVTFVTFVTVKYKAFKQLSQEGNKAISEYLQKMFGGFINSIVEKLKPVVTNATDAAVEKTKSIMQNDTFKGATSKLIETGLIDPGTVAEFSQQVNNLNSKVVLEGAVAIAQDPTIISRQLEKLSNSLKEKAIEKVKEECAKRKIPASLVGLVIAISLRDGQRTKEAFKEVVNELNLGEENTVVMMELLFPQDVSKEEMVNFISNKIMELLFAKLNLKNIQGLTPETLIEALTNFGSLEEMKLEQFVQGLRKLLKSIHNSEKKSNGQASAPTEMGRFLDILDILAIITDDNPEPWKIKQPALNLLSTGARFLTQGRYDERIAAVDNFIKFVSVMTSSYEVVNDLELNSNNTLRIMDDFCTSIGLDKQFFEARGMNLPDKFVPNLIYLIMAYTKQEAHDLPKEIIRDLEHVFNIQGCGKSDFIPFCFELASTIFNNPANYFRHLHQTVSSYNLDLSLQNFIKIITCYHLEDFEKQYSSISIEKNIYFLKAVKAIGANPNELIGLIDIICQKKSSKYSEIFLEAIVNRMGLKKDHLEAAKLLMDLLTSKDEAVVLHAVKALKLEFGQFLLVGKRILNPKFISEKQWLDVGVDEADLPEHGDLTFSSSDEFETWKSAIKNSIGETLRRRAAEWEAKSKEAKKPNSEEEERYRKFIAGATLVRQYLVDWDNYAFSKKNLITLTSILDNQENGLRRKLLTYDKEATKNGVDLLALVLSIRQLQIFEGKRYDRYDNDKKETVKELAELLGLNAMGLRNLVQMIILSDQKTVVQSFFGFFPEKKGDHEELLAKVLDSGLKQVGIITQQIEFITTRLPSYIQFTKNERKINIPVDLIKKIFFENSKLEFSISNILELCALAIEQIGTPELEKKLFQGCYNIGLFTKGLLSRKDIEDILNIKDEKLLHLFEIMNEPDQNKRLSLMTELFDTKYHPLKTAIAFYGFVTNRDFEIRHVVSKSSDPSKKYESHSIKAYLAKALKIYPEVFDLFTIAMERNIPKFIQKTLPLIRRIKNSSLVDNNLIESLFSLTMGEHFNSSYLAKKIDASSDIIDFFVSIVRLARTESRKTELADLPKLLPVQKVLSSLSIKTSELIALTRLIFNLVDDDSTVIETLKGLGLQADENARADSGIKISPTFFSGFIEITKHRKQDLNIFDANTMVDILRAKTSDFYSYMGVYHIGYFISMIAKGNFLILELSQEELDWVFPNNDLEAKVALRNLTMALCGLVNPHLEPTDDMFDEVTKFEKKFYPKEQFGFNEFDYKITDTQKVFPSNSLAYAIYLAYYTMDIAPAWTQAFFFDKTVYDEIEEKIPELKTEFVLSLVLHFIHAPEIARDFLGLYEWNEACKYFHKTATNGEEKPSFFEDSFAIKLFFVEKLTFDFEKTKEYAEQSGLLVDEDWKEIFSKPEEYNKCVNESLFYLIKRMNNSTNFDNFRYEPLLEKSPIIFLTEITEHIEKKKAITDFSQKRAAIGKQIRYAIVKCYKTVTKQLHRKDRIQGFSLTNLCMLGTIISLRNQTKTHEKYNRKLYNLHQLMMNFERKIFLDDYFFKMSKFQIMKLVGISLGVQITNLVEWCLPPSLFTKEYTVELAYGNPDQRKALRVKQCEEVALNYDKSSNIVGDLGRDILRKSSSSMPGNFASYKLLSSSFYRIEEWEDLESRLELSRFYVGNLEEENNNRTRALKKISKLFLQAKTKMSNECYHSLEQLSMLYHSLYVDEFRTDREEDNHATELMTHTMVSQKGQKFFKKEVEQFSKRNEDDERRAAGLIDPKTGLKYNKLEERLLQFERILVRPNMGFVLGIITGDPSVAHRKGITFYDDERRSPEIYKALIGLQSIRKSGKQLDRKLFKGYLSSIRRESQLESDFQKLERLLTFFITRDTNLNEIANTLEIEDNVMDFLFMNIKEKQPQNHDNDHRQQDKKSSINRIIRKVLQIEDSDLEAFEIIKNIYRFKKEGGWLKVIKLLRRDVKKAKESSNDDKENKEHPLAELVKSIDFNKLKKNVKSIITDQNFQDLIKLSEKNKGDVFSTLFEKFILPLETSLSEKVDKETLITVHELIQSLRKKDFSEIFKLLVLSDAENIYVTSTLTEIPKQKTLLSGPKLILEKVLNVFGVNTSSHEVQEGIKIMRIFLTLSNKDLSLYKNNENYQVVMNIIRKDFMNSKIVAFLGDNQDIKQIITNLLFGVLSWDLQLIIKAFLTEKTKEEAYLLYNLYGCLNINKLLTFKTEKSEQIKMHIKALMSVVLEKLFPEFDHESAPSLQDVIAEDFRGMTPDEMLKELELRVQELIDFTHQVDVSQAKSLFQHISDVFSASSVPNISTGDSNQTLVDIMTSVFDGSILYKLLDMFGEDQELKTLLLDLTRFMLKLGEKFQAPKRKKIGYGEVLTQFEVLTGSMGKIIDNQLLKDMLSMTPELLKMCLIFQSENKLHPMDQKAEILLIIKQLCEKIGDKTQQTLIYQIIHIILGFSLQTLDEKNAHSKMLSEIGYEDRKEIFLKNVLPALFATGAFNAITPYIDCIYYVVARLRTDFVQNYKDPKKLREIAGKILRRLTNSGLLDNTLAPKLVELLDGNLGSGLEDVITALLPEDQKQSAGKLITYLSEVQNTLNFDFVNKISSSFNERRGLPKRSEVDSAHWDAILKKFKEGTASPADLFQVVDEAGDKNGAIDEKEFQILAKRLGLKLSDHRIKEIFAKVKGTKSKGGAELELNEKEFSQALEYLQSKNLLQALQLLGITPEILAAVFIRLLVLLILLLAFIFLGISAFAIGGTFGSIVNSIFPAAGGLALGKEKQSDKDKMNPKSVEEAANTGFDITVSEQL